MAADYMAQALSRDGAIFKPEHIRYKKRLQLRQYDALVFYGDLSYKDKGDYKAMLLVGKTGREVSYPSKLLSVNQAVPM